PRLFSGTSSRGVTGIEVVRRLLLPLRRHLRRREFRCAARTAEARLREVVFAHPPIIAFTLGLLRHGETSLLLSFWGLNGWDAPVVPRRVRCASPTALPPVPGVEQIGEAVVDEARQRPHRRIAEQRREPALAGGEPPDRERDVGADQEPPG